MKQIYLLSADENTSKIEDEEKSKFLRAILEYMNIPISEFWKTDDPLTVDQRIKLRSILSSYNISVIDDLSGEMQIYVEKDLVGDWHKPHYKLKTDLRQIDPRKKYYLEMETNFWTVFEDENTNE